MGTIIYSENDYKYCPFCTATNTLNLTPRKVKTIKYNKIVFGVFDVWVCSNCKQGFFKDWILAEQPKSDKDELQFKININNKFYQTKEEFINGVQIKILSDTPLNFDYGVWIKGDDGDKNLKDNEKIQLFKDKTIVCYTGAKQTVEG